jgi:repressor LexA
MAEPLTPLERDVYHYLLDFLAEHTFQPSIRDIGRRFRIPSTKTVADVLTQLEMKGYIERGVSRSRGVRIVGYAGPTGAQPVPLYARAHAAPPPFRREDIIRHYTLDRRLLPVENAFLARVTGSAIAARGFLDGDLAIVNPATRAAQDAVVALRIGEWIHVRAVRHEGAKLVLESDEADEETLGRGDDYTVLGVVCGVVRAQDGKD